MSQSQSSSQSKNELKVDLKKIQAALEDIDNKIDRLKDKKQQLIKAKNNISSILQSDDNSGSQYDKYPQKNPIRSVSSDGNPEKYQYKSGRRLYTDAYKCFIVKLCDDYNLKSIEKHTGVLYTNIIRWRLEMQRGKFQIDHSYKPNLEELQKIKRMEKYSNKYEQEQDMKKYYDAQKMEKEQDEDNRLSPLTNSDDGQDDQDDYQQLRNHHHQQSQQQQQHRHGSKRYHINQQENLASSDVYSPEGILNEEEKLNQEEDNMQNEFNIESILEINPNFNTPWYSQFEMRLVKELNETKSVDQKLVINIAKNLRNQMNILDKDLKFTREWFTDLVNRRQIQLHANS